MVISKATLGRLPMYLRYIKSQTDGWISAAEVARSLELGEEKVRKDLNSVCALGKPKIGFPRHELLKSIEKTLGAQHEVPVVVAGAGKLGRALMSYRGFDEFGLKIVAGFDIEAGRSIEGTDDCPVLPVEKMSDFCHERSVSVGIIAVPFASAQQICDRMVESGITAILNFSECALEVPEGIVVQNENLALSLAHLRLGNNMSFRGRGRR